MNFKNISSEVCLLLVVTIIFVMSSTKVAGDSSSSSSSSIVVTERSSYSVCNGSVGECGTGDEVEMLLMDSPRRQLGRNSKAGVSYDTFKPDQHTCSNRCFLDLAPKKITSRPCPPEMLRCKSDIGGGRRN
ncbi:hypothetical protein AgCh_015249 [Apium graveolens]